MSELSTPEWNAKILKALKENSRRFAKAGTVGARTDRKPTGRTRRGSAKKASTERRAK